MSEQAPAPQPMNNIEDTAQTADAMAAEQAAHEALLSNVAAFAKDPANEFAAGSDIKNGLGLSHTDILGLGYAGFSELKKDALDWQSKVDAQTAKDAEQQELINGHDAWKAERQEHRDTQAAKRHEAEVDATQAQAEAINARADQILTGLKLKYSGDKTDQKTTEKLYEQAVERASQEINPADFPVETPKAEGLKVPVNKAAEARQAELVAALKAHDRATLTSNKPEKTVGSEQSTNSWKTEPVANPVAETSPNDSANEDPATSEEASKSTEQAAVSVDEPVTSETTLNDEHTVEDVEPVVVETAESTSSDEAEPITEAWPDESSGAKMKSYNELQKEWVDEVFANPNAIHELGLKPDSNGFISPADLGRALSEQHGIELNGAELNHILQNLPDVAITGADKVKSTDWSTPVQIRTRIRYDGPSLARVGETRPKEEIKMLTDKSDWTDEQLAALEAENVAMVANITKKPEKLSRELRREAKRNAKELAYDKYAVTRTTEQMRSLGGLSEGSLPGPANAGPEREPNALTRRARRLGRAAMNGARSLRRPQTGAHAENRAATPASFSEPETPSTTPLPRRFGAGGIDITPQEQQYLENYLESIARGEDIRV